ncbi:hypothetical protein XENORESO_016247 [Xenotaenia resolanae]|uniref:Apple domain-containing protein n=1 Tax=Xenotaenia resolanae TaxID=208358 RepID=A0ABV0WTK8_9TELE
MFKAEFARPSSGLWTSLACLVYFLSFRLFILRVLGSIFSGEQNNSDHKRIMAQVKRTSGKDCKEVAEKNGNTFYDETYPAVVNSSISSWQAVTCTERCGTSSATCLWLRFYAAKDHLCLGMQQRNNMT